MLIEFTVKNYKSIKDTLTKKQLSKINLSIQELIKTCLELDSIESFNTRDKYIVAKIKFYNWLNEEDVETICEKLLLDVNTILQIKDKFNEKFLTFLQIR